jgi:hypothetical protein
LTLTAEASKQAWCVVNQMPHCLPFNIAGDRGAHPTPKIGRIQMNVLKLALLGTAAVAAVSVSARADDLSDMKAQIEALNSRIASLESTPSVPAGFKLLSVSETDAIIVPGFDEDKMYGKKATNIGILPTADVPASTNIQWTGFVRAHLAYYNFDADDGVSDRDGLNLKSKAGIKVVATTDTAVVEVGVRVAMVAAADSNGTNRSHPSVSTDGYWGWWKMTPELTLAGGVDGTLANSSNLFDNRCTCIDIDTGGAFGRGDPTQVRLTYASGPISFAIALEDGDNTISKSALGVAAEMKYSGDSVSFDLNGGYYDTATAGDADWIVDASASFALGDIASIGVGIGAGEGNGVGGFSHTTNDSYWRAGMFAGFTLSDAVAAEFGVTYTDHDVAKFMTVGAGIYYTPVSQLTLGLEASYNDTNVKGAVAPIDGETMKAALVSIYRF